MTDIDAYVQPAAAATWLAAHVAFIAAWTAATADQKSAALVEASDNIDVLPLKGCKYADDISQLRAFPRYPDRAGQAIGGDETNFQSDIDYSAVPQEVLDACCLEALEILKQGASGRKDLREQGVKQYSIGGKLSETFDEAPVPKLLSRKARDKLRFWIGSLVEAV
ncbi:hypothetical protein M0R72_11765 [Candidatus Pacearchaeota archaeon]|jgi:hypothetical protein|nr:hypothetical protein [Candidatus Pacearchaeota archaeon]